MERRAVRRSGRVTGRRGVRSVSAAALLALLLAACGTDQPVAGPGASTTHGRVSTTVVTTVAPAAGRGWLDEHDSWWGADGEMAGGDMAGAPDGPVAMPAGGATEASGSGLASQPPVAEVGLSAGSVDDNERWDDYLRYVEDVERLGIPFRPYDVSGRRVVTVRDGTGRPALAAAVVVTDPGGAEVSRARTDAHGRALVFVPTGGSDQQSRPAFTLTVSKGAVTWQGQLPADLTVDVPLPEPTETVGAARLDVLFVIDATGSMSDEIERLKANMISVAERIAALDARPDVRFGMTVYRDQGDLFVTRTFDFTGDVAAFTAALGEVVADGGGDTPEDVEAALADALAKPAWRTEDTVSLAVLVADAPPHLDYEGSTPYTASIDRARAAGVKVFPVASSGLDDQGEMVFRQLAQATLGRFVFLTYGADGMSPGSSTPHHVDGYSTLPLDDLVVQLVADELAARP
jgi:hypothetical protein